MRRGPADPAAATVEPVEARPEAGRLSLAQTRTEPRPPGRYQRETVDLDPQIGDSLRTQLEHIFPGALLTEPVLPSRDEIPAPPEQPLPMAEVVDEPDDATEEVDPLDSQPLNVQINERLKQIVALLKSRDEREAEELRIRGQELELHLQHRADSHKLSAARTAARETWVSCAKQYVLDPRIAGPAAVLGGAVLGAAATGVTLLNAWMSGLIPGSP